MRPDHGGARHFGLRGGELSLISAKRLRAVIAFLLVLAFILVWQFGFQSRETKSTLYDPAARIDWYVNDGLMTRFDLQGTRSSMTDTDRIVHFEGRRESELTRPYSVGFKPNQEVTHTLSALSAIYKDDNSQLELAEQVELHHNPETDQAVAMFTPSLTYFPQRELAITHDPVEITSSSGETRAIGMEFYTAENRMELLSRVRGNYVATEKR